MFRAKTEVRLTGTLFIADPTGAEDRTGGQEGHFVPVPRGASGNSELQVIQFSMHFSNHKYLDIIFFSFLGSCVLYRFSVFLKNSIVSSVYSFNLIVLVDYRNSNVYVLFKIV